MGLPRNSPPGKASRVGSDVALSRFLPWVPATLFAALVCWAFLDYYVIPPPPSDPLEGMGLVVLGAPWSLLSLPDALFYGTDRQRLLGHVLVNGFPWLNVILGYAVTRQILRPPR